jgi:YVTN family beta-propeller protein
MASFSTTEGRGPGSTPGGQATNLTPLTIVGTTPDWATYDPSNGYLYVSNYGGGNVTVVNGATQRVVANLSLGSGTEPLRPTYDPRNGYIYVPESQTDVVAIISGATDTFVANLTSCSDPHSVILDSTNGYAYVPCYSGVVDVVNGASKLVAITVGSESTNGAFDAHNNLVYVLNQGSDNITLINGTTDKTASSVATTTSPGYVTFDPSNYYLYVAKTSAGVVSVLNGAMSPTKNVLIANLTVGSTPYQPTYDPHNGLVYVPNSGSGNVSVINGSRLNGTSRISVGAEPYLVTYDAANQLLYVPDYGGASLSVVNTSKNAVVQTFTVGSSPHWVTFDPGNGVVYTVNSGSDNLTVLPTAAVWSVASPRVGTTPVFAATDSWNGYVYEPNSGSSNVTVLNGTTNAVIANLALPSGSDPGSAVFNPVNGRVYVMDRGIGKVTILNGTTVLANVSVGSGAEPTLATVDTTTGQTYVLDQGSGNTSVFGAVANRVIANVTTGATPQAGVFDSTNGYVYVADYGSSSVTAVNGATRSVVATVRVGSSPLWPAFDPKDGFVYVPTSGSDTIDVISGTSITANLTDQLNPHAAVYDPANGYVYVTQDAPIGLVTVLSGSSIVGSAPAGNYSLLAAANPSNGFVFVSNSGGSNVTVLNGTTSIASFNTGSGPSGLAFSPVSSEVYVLTSGTSNLTVLGTKGPIVGVRETPPQQNATNVTLAWTTSSSGTNSTVVWGSSATQLAYTTYPSGSASSPRLFINYLQPAKTYSFLVSERAAGYVPSLWQGSWTTSGDSMSYVSGEVYNASGGQGSGSHVRPSNMWVQVSCEKYPSAYSEDSNWWGYSETSESGMFNVSTSVYYLGFLIGTNPCSNSAYVVSVDNYGNNGSSTWNSQWNETIVTWAPQTVDFFLPDNYVSPKIPMTFDFTNLTNSVYNLTTSSTFTNTESNNLTISAAIDGLSVGGGAYRQTIRSQTTTQILPGAWNETYWYGEEFFTSGTEVFSVLNRSVNFFPDYFESANDEAYGGSNQADWTTTPPPACDSSPAVYCVWGMAPSTGAIMTVGGSLTLGSSFDVGVSVPVDIPGIGTLTTALGTSYTTTFTSQTSWAISFYWKHPDSVHCYGVELYYQGGNATGATSGTGISMHAWYLGEDASQCVPGD